MKKVVPDEQKGCRKYSRGTKEQHLTDKQILNHCKKHHSSLAMGWIDYKRPMTRCWLHRWTIEAMKMVGIVDNIVNLFENSKETWRTNLRACNESLWEVNIRRGIFQGDSFFPLLFVVVLIPLSIILNQEIKTRKLINMNRSLHQRRNVGLIICEERVNVEVQSLKKYLRESEECMLKLVAGEKRLSEMEDSGVFKMRLKEEKISHWLEKSLHGRFLKDTEKVSTKRTRQWLKGVYLKKEIEAIVCAAQGICVISIKNRIDGQDVSPICRLYGESSDMVMHLSSGCLVLAKSKYGIRHDITGKHVRWDPYRKQVVHPCTQCCNRDR